MGMKHKFFKKSFDYRSPTDCAKQILHVFNFCALNRPIDFGGAMLREGGVIGVVMAAV